MRLAALLLLTSASAFGQSVNVDFGANDVHPSPLPAYAAAGLAGAWNSVPAPTSGHSVGTIDGQPSAVRVGSSGGVASAAFDNPLTLGGDDRLMDDYHLVGGPGSLTQWGFDGLADGEYLVLTYAWTPSDANARTRVSVLGSPDPDQVVGGAWSGHQLGTTYARHRVSVVSGILVITLTTVSGAGAVNGVQVVRLGTFAPLCAGDGGGAACPCGNAGAPGRGCASSVSPTGALLTGTGSASVAMDTLVLAGSGMPDSSALYFQGTSAVASGAGVAFGDGLRCAAGTTIRLGTKAIAAGNSQYPTAGDSPVSVRGAVNAGDLRVYQVWYRNAATFCTPDTFNLTNALAVAWGA